MSDKVNSKRSRDELSDDEDEFSVSSDQDEFSVSSDQAVSYKQHAPHQFIDIPSSVPPSHAKGEVSPLDGIIGFDHTRLSPQALQEHDLRQPSLGFETYVRRPSANTRDTDTVTTLTNSSNNPTPVKARKRVRFTSNNMYNDDGVNIDNDSDNDKEVEDISNLFNITLNTPPSSPASDDANVGGSRHRRKSSRVTRRKRKRINKSKTRKAKKNKKTRKSRYRKNKRYSQSRTKSKNKRREK